MKQPAIQFYWGDWKKDPAVQSCSLAARALWFEMLCCMSESSERGYLLTSAGKPMSDEQLTRTASADNVKQVRELKAELQEAGVFSIDAQGRIFNRRMVRDESLIAVRREAGGKGGRPKQNGTKNESKTEANQKAKPKQNITPSASSSASASLAAAAEGNSGNQNPAAETGWPKFSAFVRDLFPDAGEPLLKSIVEDAIREHPPITDDELVSAARAATKPKQFSAALYKTTIPEVIRSWKAAA